MLNAEVANVSSDLGIAASHPINHSLIRRLLTVALVLAVECVAIAGAPHPWCSIHREMVGGIAFCGALALFGRKRLSLERIDATPIDRRFLALHLLALILIVASYLYLLKAALPGSVPAEAATFLWFAAIALVVVSAVATVAPWRKLFQIARGLGATWAYAALCALFAAASRPIIVWLWETPGSHLGRMLQSGTLSGVHAILTIFYRGVVLEPASVTIGTAKFQVQVAGGCSGIEGLALMLILSVGWLIFAHRELRLARAIWLVPVTLGAIWLLNLVRIAALIAIGDAGHEAVAVGGFHSEAGWIFFNFIAISFLFAANHLPWLRKNSTSPVLATESSPNLAAVYLLPFLTILAASLIAQAASSGFEWLYPLRLVAALAALWFFRRHLLQIDWRFDWLGPLAGAAVFLLWLAFAQRILPPGSGDPLASALAHLKPLQRTVWLSARVFAAVITVPIAEELAFRGFVARRIVAEDVESVSYSRLGWLPILISSAVFGVLHGRLWLAGVLAGVVFALVAKLRNRLGEAVAAHATANLLIAIWVLARGDFSLW